MNVYFVYIYRHPITNIPFYVGYGKNRRHLDHLNEALKYPKPQKGKHKLNAIRKIIIEGQRPIIQIIDAELTKEHACELEVFLISLIGRADKGEGPLTNLTMGGDGNRDWGPESRKAMSNRFKDIISAKDPVTGKRLRVHKDDPRWLNGKLVGQNFGTVNSNKNGKLNGYIISKNIMTGEIVKLKPNDIRWLSGEYVGINKGSNMPDEAKNKISNSLKEYIRKFPRGKRCTIDGIKIYKSLKDLTEDLGKGKRGARHPNFRYV